MCAVACYERCGGGGATTFAEREAIAECVYEKEGARLSLSFICRRRTLWPPTWPPQLPLLPSGCQRTQTATQDRWRRCNWQRTAHCWCARHFLLCSPALFLQSTRDT